MITWSNFHTEDRQISGDTIHSLVNQATWLPGFVNLLVYLIMLAGRTSEILCVCGNNATRDVIIFVKVTKLYSRNVWHVYCYIAWFMGLDHSLTYPTRKHLKNRICLCPVLKRFWGGGEHRSFEFFTPLFLPVFQSSTRSFTYRRPNFILLNRSAVK
jgi:hypothetical protein